MTAIPSVEAILIEIQQSFGSGSLQTIEKRRFANLGMRMSEQYEKATEILFGICKSLDFRHDPELLDDLLSSAMELFQFHSAVENGTRTFGADDRQIAWHLLAYQFAPGLARKYGFWSLASPVAPGMPGGDLWFVPTPGPSDDSRLRLPVQIVAEWWLDLLDCTWERIWGDDEDSGNRIRNLQYWQAGKLPSPDTIQAAFGRACVFPYNGVFDDRPNDPLEVRFKEALKFVTTRKRLDAVALAKEIPSVPAPIFEAALSNAGHQQEREAFIAAVSERWRKPSNDSVRRRFLLARVVQDGHIRLARLLSPNVEADCTDSASNKILQLWALFRETYRLTVEADKGCQSETESNTRFAALVPKWLAGSLLTSIMNVHRGAPEEFILFLTDRFRELESDGNIRDLFKDGGLPTGPEEPKVANAHALRLDFEGRLEKLKNTLKDRRRNDADSLLRQLNEHPRKNEFLADVLYLEGIHRLNGNDVDRAKELFDGAFEACRDGGYGSTRKNAAYACLGIAMAFDYFSERAERYFRVIATSMDPSEIAAYHPEELESKHTLDIMFRDISVRASEMFWKQMYRPYPGVVSIAPPAQEQIRDLVQGLFPHMLEADGEAIERWVGQNRKIAESRLRYVTGDTFFGTMMKMTATGERNLRASLLPREIAMEIGEIVVRFRTVIHMLAEKLDSKALNTPDYKKQTPLMLAADQGDAKLVGILLGRGVDFDAQDIVGRTALHSAAASHSVECYLLILKNGANPTKETVDGASALHTAVKFGVVEAVRVTLEKWPTRFKQDEIADLFEIARDFHTNYKKWRPQMAAAGRALGPKSAYKMITDILEQFLERFEQQPMTRDK